MRDFLYRRSLRGALLVALFAVLAYGVGCDSDDPDPDTTVDDDIANIDASLDAMLDGIAALESGSLSDAIKSFLDPSSGDYENAAWAEDIIDGLDGVISFDEVEDNRAFDFAANRGVYVWNATTGAWSRTGTSDTIVLRFPTSPSASTNGAELTLSAYADASVTIDGDLYRLPTRVEAALTVDGDRVLFVNLRDVTYDSGNSIPVPTAFALDIFTAPHTHTFTYRRNTSTNFDFDFTLRNSSGTRVTGIELGVTLAHDDYDELEVEDIEGVTATLYASENLQIDFSGDIGALAALEDPSETQVNSLLSAEVFYNDQKIGDLEYDEGTEDVLIIYKDGESESTDRYYDSFLDRLEAIWVEYTGDLDL